MPENPEKPKTGREGAFESDSSRVELYRPKSILRTTEWGLLTISFLLSSFAFPPYFISVLVLAFFNAGGLLWVTHLNEKGRLRLIEFEKEFSEGHQREEAGQFAEAIAFYQSLVPKYQDFPKISEIASHRIQHLKAKLEAQAKAQAAMEPKSGPKRRVSAKKKKKKEVPKGRRG